MSLATPSDFPQLFFVKCTAHFAELPQELGETVYTEKLNTVIVCSVYLATSLPLTKYALQLFFLKILNRKKENENEKRMSVGRTSWV